MSRNFRGWLSFGAPLLAALIPLVLVGHASADAAGDKVLAGMEAATNRAKTQYFEYEVINQEPGKAEKKMDIKVYIKGEKRLTEFTSGDMKGTKVLIESPTQMYVYLPAFGKVRRIASHVTDQGFMGLAFSQDDLATQIYSTAYATQAAVDSGSDVKLAVTPKAGQSTPNGKIEFTISKEKNVPSEIKYYNAAGNHIKTETRTGYKCEGNICAPGELKMVDHSKGGHWTKMVMKSWKVNESLSDDLFTKRNLEK